MAASRVFLNYFAVEIIFGVPSHFGESTKTVLRQIADILQHGMLRSSCFSKSQLGLTVVVENQNSGHIERGYLQEVDEGVTNNDVVVLRRESSTWFKEKKPASGSGYIRPGPCRRTSA